MDTLSFLIKTSRPPFWLGVVVFFVAGTLSVGIFDIRFWIGLLFCTLPAGLIINGINDIADRESDMQNPRKVLSGNVLNDEKVKIITYFSLGFVLFFLGTFIILNSYYAVITIILILLVWIAYSVKPFRLKGIPIVDSLTNGFGMLLFFVLGYSFSIHSLDAYIQLPHIFLPLFGGVVAVHALQTLWDYDVDKKAKDKTIGGLFHIRGTLFLCLILYVLIFSFFQFVNRAIVVYLALAIGLCIIMLISPKRKVIYRSTWILLYGFVFLFAYLFFFNQEFLRSIVVN